MQRNAYTLAHTLTFPFPGPKGCMHVSREYANECIYTLAQTRPCIALTGPPNRCNVAKQSEWVSLHQCTCAANVLAHTHVHAKFQYHCATNMHLNACILALTPAH